MKDVIAAVELGGGIWRFSERREEGQAPFVDAYLVVGNTRAVMIDCLQTATGLYEAARQRTDLPLDLVITHGHGDHAGKSMKEFYDSGCSIYMDKRDLAALQESSGERYPETWFSELRHLNGFDLGGVWLEVLPVPGHTIGSTVLLDEKRQLVFTGDAVGAGIFWMHLPAALGLRRFQDSLELFWDRIKEMKQLQVMPGHSSQSSGKIGLSYIKDIRTITSRILSGVWTGEAGEMQHRTGVLPYKCISYGHVSSYLYDPERLGFLRADPRLEALKDQFEEGELRNGAFRMGYMLYTPRERKKGEAYPLVIYLHGAGERGSEARAALANSGGTTFAEPEWQVEHPCYVFAPQCAEEAFWTMECYEKLLVKAITSLLEVYVIDRNRIYITGLSMGGMGTWNMIAKRPELFAAAMPICGAADPAEMKRAKDVPVWAFHAADDPVVPAFGSMMIGEKRLYGTRQIVALLRECGNRKVCYTEYPEGHMLQVCGIGAHASWIPAYEDRKAKEWLFSHSLKDRYSVESIMPGVWHIQDADRDSFYVVEGSEKALVIDTGMGGESILEVVKALTGLPLALAVTHCHGDHMYHAEKFGRFYMSGKEKSILPRFLSMMMPDSKLTEADIIEIDEGDVIDLGGVAIEVREIGGHTPGSVAFLDRTHGLCFSGDALGSGMGVWMQVPGALCLSEYKRNLERFYQGLKGSERNELAFMTGHRDQAWGYPGHRRYNPVTEQTVADMITLCGQLLEDNTETIALSDCKSFSEEPVLTASYRSAAIVFTQSGVK